MKQLTGRKMLGILLTLALVLGLLPGITLTAYADTSYNLWVGGVEVNDQTLSDTGWIFDPNSNTLTLKGVNISTGHNSAGIYYMNSDDDASNKPLIVILQGENSIGGSGISTGIYGGGWYGSLTFSGNGSLNATGTSSGIGTAYGSVQIDSGAINASGTMSGIYAGGSITINGGKVEATGTTYGIAAKGVSMTGGTVIAKATNSTSDTTCYAIHDGLNGISITGGTVTAIGTSSSGEAYGLYKGSTGNIRIDAGITSLTVTGTTSASHGTVENSIAGMGWNTVKGSGDGTEIAANPKGASLDTYKKLLFPYTKKPAATVKNPPTDKTLTYTGAAQELVTAGTAENGTMYYALGNDATTVPTDGWSTAIPTGTDAGTYYVWYKAVGDATHTDSDAACVTVTIAAKPAPTEAPTSVPTATPKPVPKTGDNANPSLWLAMMLVALIGFAGLAVTGTMKASRKKK